MQSSLNSLAIVILFIFFIEILIARRVYRNSRKNNHIRSNSQMYVILQHSSHPAETLQQNTINGRPIKGAQQPVPQYLLAHPQQPLAKSPSTQFAFISCTGSIFLITFLTISYLLRPFTNFWGLYFLPILLPLPFLALPSILQSKTYSTFFYLLTGLGLGFLLILLL